MITIPLYIFLIIYSLFLLAILILFFVNIKHLFTTGSLTASSFLITIFVLAAATLIIWFTWALLIGTNWANGFVFFDSSWFNAGAASTQIF